MTSNIEQLTGKAPRSKSVHPEANISQEQPKGPTKMGLKIKTVLQLNEESRLANSSPIDEESSKRSRWRCLETEEEMEMPSEENRSQNQTILAISEKKDPEPDPIKSQDLKATQDEKFINILSENKHSPIYDKQTSMSTSPGPCMTSTSSR